MTRYWFASREGGAAVPMSRNPSASKETCASGAAPASRVIALIASPPPSRPFATAVGLSSVPTTSPFGTDRALDRPHPAAPARTTLTMKPIDWNLVRDMEDLERSNRRGGKDGP